MVSQHNTYTNISYPDRSQWCEELGLPCNSNSIVVLTHTCAPLGEGNSKAEPSSTSLLETDEGEEVVPELRLYSWTSGL